MQPTITMIERPEPYMREAIVRPLIAFNNSRASQPEDYRPLVIILSDPDSGGILAAYGVKPTSPTCTSISCSSLKRCEAPVTVDKCCFRRNKKRKLVAVEACGWIHTAFRRADSTSV
jgi:hypothetical protein